MSEPAPSRDVTRITLAVLCLALLISASYWVMRPFLPALIWASMIVIATWPIMQKAQDWLGGKRAVAVALMTVLLLLVFVTPVWLAVSTIVDNSSIIMNWAGSVPNMTFPPPPDWLSSLPLAGPRLAARWQQLAIQDKGELAARSAPYVAAVLTWFGAQVGGFGLLFLHFLLTVILSAILYARGEAAAAHVSNFAHRLAGSRGQTTATLAAQAIRAVALGVVVTALCQSIIAGIGLMIAGIPYAVLLTAVIFMMGVIQVGPLPVMVPTVIWVYWSGSTGWGTFLLVWTIVVCLLDNLLRPLLIKKGADLPLLLIFAGVLGGMFSFGVIGLFVGPVVLAVTYTLLIAWVQEDAGSAAQAAPAQEEKISA